MALEVHRAAERHDTFLMTLPGRCGITLALDWVLMPPPVVPRPKRSPEGPFSTSMDSQLKLSRV